jgi:hypothetical protein
MNCTRCNGQIQAEDCNLSTLVARCRACQHVFRFADQLEPEAQEPPATLRAKRPANLVVDNRSSAFGRRIWWPWADARAKSGTILVCVYCDAMLALLWFFPSNPQRLYDPAYLVPMSFFVAVAVCLNYYTVARVVNRTSVELDGGQLTLRHGPVPWPGNRAFEMADVDEVVFDDDSQWRQGVLTHRFYVTVID